jgi:hypothetical protein
VIWIYNQVLARYLFTIHNHREYTESEMLKNVKVCIDGAEKVIVCYHGEQESFGYTPHNSLINRE